MSELCNELTLVIDQEMNETLSEFRLIPEDVEPEGKAQPDLMAFETPRPGNEIGSRGKRATALNRDCMNIKLNCSWRIQILHR